MSLRKMLKKVTYAYAQYRTRILSLLSLFFLALVLPLTIFMVQQQQEIRQHAAGGGGWPQWSAWNTLGGVLTEAPATTVFQNQIYAIARGTGDNIFVKHSSDGLNYVPTDYQNIGGVATSKPAAAASPSQLLLVVRGANNAPYITRSNDGTTFSAWQAIDGNMLFGPAAAFFQGQFYIFAVGTGNHLYVTRSSDGINFSPWQDLSGVLTEAPAVTVFQNQLYVFARGSENAIYSIHSADGTSYTGWTSLGGVALAGPAATSVVPVGGSETLFVFSEGTNNLLFERHSTDGSGFTDWQDITTDYLMKSFPWAGYLGSMGSAPAATSFHNQVYIFARGQKSANSPVDDNTLWERSSLSPDNFGSSAFQQTDKQALTQPSVFSPNSIWVMPYSGSGNYIYYGCQGGTVDSQGTYQDQVWRGEISPDGKSTSPLQLVIRGTSGANDGDSCSPGVVDVNGIWHMYYVTGNNLTQSSLYIYHATSTAPGTTWSKKGPITLPGITATSYIESPSPLYINGQIILYLVATKGILYRATSSDGTNFSAFTPVNGVEGATHGRVQYYNGMYYYVYAKLPPGETYDFNWPMSIPWNWHTGRAIYLATSTDGINFTPGKLMFAANGTDWDADNTWSPDIVFAGSQMRIYYSANSNMQAPLYNGVWGTRFFVNPFAPQPTPTAVVSTPTAAVNPASYNPKGYFDGVTNGVAYGWTCDPDNYTQALAVRLYIDGAAGSGAQMYPVSASVAREPAVGGQCGGNVNHGFVWAIPETLKDGKAHTVYVYAINIGQGTTNPLLGQKTFTMTLPPTAVPTLQPSKTVSPSPTHPAPTATGVPPPQSTAPPSGDHPQPTSTSAPQQESGAAPSRATGDVTGDGTVNLSDLSALLSKWNSSDPQADLNHDGKVNLIDLSLLLTHWGK